LGQRFRLPALKFEFSVLRNTESGVQEVIQIVSELLISKAKRKIAMLDVQTDVENGQNLRVAYQTLCTSYNGVDTLRHQFLAILPLASGGIFTLLTNSDKLDASALAPIGIFGCFITLGLYIFEIYGTRRCTHLIILGQYLESQLKIEGQFRHRPRGLEGLSKQQKLRAMISEPMAAGIIYPAVGAAWVYLALQSKPVKCPPESMQAPMSNSILISVLIFGFWFIASYMYNSWLTFCDAPRKAMAPKIAEGKKGEIEKR
jgi:hypothetical protein